MQRQVCCPSDPVGPYHFRSSKGLSELYLHKVLLAEGFLTALLAEGSMKALSRLLRVPRWFEELAKYEQHFFALPFHMDGDTPRSRPLRPKVPNSPRPATVL